MKTLYAIASGVALLACLAVPFAYFWGRITMDGYKMWLLIASIAWFIFATLWATTRTSAHQSD